MSRDGATSSSSPEEHRTVIREGAGPVVTVRLHRPAAGNALSRSAISELRGALESISTDPSVSVVVMTGCEGAFCSGHDLKEFAASTPKEIAASTVAATDLVALMHNMPQPIIAKVRGSATAAGVELVAACDLAYAGEGARFGTPGINVGFFCFTPMVALSRSTHSKHALEMLLRGRLVTAEQAFRIGLINEVVPDTALDELVDGIAQEIAGKPAFTTALGKRGFYRQAHLSRESAYALACELVAQSAAHADATEGVRAFKEKRPPQWRPGTGGEISGHGESNDQGPAGNERNRS